MVGGLDLSRMGLLSSHLWHIINCVYMSGPNASGTGPKVKSVEFGIKQS